MGAVCAIQWKLKTRGINRVCCATKLKAGLLLYVCPPRRTYCATETQLYVPSRMCVLAKSERSSVSSLPSKLSYRLGFLSGEGRGGVCGVCPLLGFK